MNIKNFLKKKIKKSFKINKISKKNKPIIKKNLKKTKLGEYQVNNIMKIASKKKKNSYKLAIKIAKKINLIGISKIIISKPGFINISLSKNWLEKKILLQIKSKRNNIPKLYSEKVIIDYSSPNISKEMHVGHLRSTILGDATAKIMKFLGYKVIKINHIGDWGLNFGIIISYLIKFKINIKKISLKNLNKYYVLAKKKYKKSKKFKKISQNYSIKLQNEKKKYIKLWKKIVKITINENQKLYQKLKINLNKKNIIGESKYRKMLPKITKELTKKKIAIKKKGCIIIFLNEFKNKKGKKMGVIIKKKNGLFLYTTIDIACIKYRFKKLKANRIIYYTDSRQKQHLKQVWIISKKAGYIPKKTKLEHHSFGMMLKKNKKPFKTRSGNIITLKSLIKKSILKAKKIILKKNPNIKKNKLKSLSEKIGIGAIKYSDLSKNRKTDYIFNWNNILSFQGNTALYIQYSYTRIISILKKNTIKKKIKQGNFKISNKIELKLSIKLLQFEEILIKTTKKGYSNILCNYLYELSVNFSYFYEKYSILFSNIKKKKNRLKLIFLIKKTLKLGLKILGISVIKKM
ncbi:arginine--tRNA ligase [Buchnera aphidicola]|uniref:arginine--tRNA ligase n=1 Tax=Buchnera aphidicola TaxID=9 RepID=UPI0031B7F73E